LRNTAYFCGGHWPPKFQFSGGADIKGKLANQRAALICDPISLVEIAFVFGDAMSSVL